MVQVADTGAGSNGVSGAHLEPGRGSNQRRGVCTDRLSITFALSKNIRVDTGESEPGTRDNLHFALPITNRRVALGERRPPAFAQWCPTCILADNGGRILNCANLIRQAGGQML